MTSKAIIIGAPRSGTNLLRDLLTSFNGIDTWPCDEINYIWRHGNRSYPSDQFEADMATDSIKKYIRERFRVMSKKKSTKIVIEKTCANSLRVPFVQEVVPEAKFIFIVRDGVDSVDSIVKRWGGEVSFRYLARKARYVPISDVPFYLGRFVTSQTKKMVSGRPERGTWGPVFDGMRELRTEIPLVHTAAMQWKWCVDLAGSALSSFGDMKVFRLSYEDLIQNSVQQMAAVLNFLEYDQPNERIEQACSVISSHNVGKGRRVESLYKDEALSQILNDTLDRHGYRRL